METYGVDRKAAQGYVAEQLAPILADKEAQKELAYNEAYKNASTKLNIFKKIILMEYHPSKQSEYDAIKDEMSSLEKASENACIK